MIGMAVAKILRIYLDEVPLNRARKGNFVFVNRVTEVFEGQDFRVELRKNSDAERLKSAARKGYSLFLMDDPFHPRSLTMRRAYYYPYWRIEATAKRWEWQVAKATFNPDDVDPKPAADYAERMRRWIFRAARGEPRGDGFVYVPLQGRLLDKRSFQALSPVGMIEALLAKEPARQIAVSFHPGETYTEAEQAAIRNLADRYRQIEITRAPMAQLLRDCDYVATQNSSVALSGYFNQKRALLFGKIDFHHIAANVPALGVDGAFEALDSLDPDFARYVYWFLVQTTISARADDVGDRILSAVRSHGWGV